MSKSPMEGVNVEVVTAPDGIPVINTINGRNYATPLNQHSDAMPLDLRRKSVRTIQEWEDSDEMAYELAERLFALYRAHLQP